MRFIIVSLALALLLVGCTGSPKPSGGKMAPKVGVLTVAKQQLRPTRRFLGRVQAIEDVAIQPRVSGYIETKTFLEGEPVEKGAVLYTIEDDQYLIARDRAQGSLQRAEAEANTAGKAFERGKQLLQTKAIAPKDYDELVGRHEAAKAAVTEAKAALAAAQWDLDHTRILAPFSGRAGRALVSVGDLVSPGSGPVAHVISVDPMQIAFDLDEKAVSTHLRQMAAGTVGGKESVQVRIILPDGHAYEHIGAIDFIDNRVDPNTGTIAARASIPNPDGMLVPGFFVKVIMELRDLRELLTIPIRAVQEDQQGRYVLVVERSTRMVKRQSVELGERYGIDWAVTGGLNPGDQVIVEGIQKVRLGQQVNATEMHKPAAAETVPADAPAPADTTTNTGADDGR